MLTELLAAATPPAAPATRTVYDWWSDIWLPAIVGLGSVAIAVVAVSVAMRSNRLARAATRAAERSNAIAKRALAHDEARALEADRQAGRAERELFVSRAVQVLDELADYLEMGDGEEAARAHDKVSLVQFESLARGFKAAPMDRGVSWLTTVMTDHGEMGRPDAFLTARRSYHAALAAWATKPEEADVTAAVLERILQEQLAGKELRDIQIP